jgi:peptide/nickel transport system substrate-binding protein
MKALLRAPLSRRAALLGVTATSLGVVAACAPAPAAQAPAPTAAPAAKPTTAPAAPVAPAATSAPAAKPAEQPKAGGKLRFARQGGLPRLQPSGGGNFETVWSMFDRLTEYDENRVPQGRLAESFEVSPDGKQIKLNLRKGVTWHSGRAFTSEDVAWNLKFAADPKHASFATMGVLNRWFPSVETPDANTAILRSESPRPMAFDYFEWFSIQDRIEMANPAEGQRKMIGTGPFKLADYKEGLSERIVKNPSYWQNGKPYLDEIEFTFMADDQAMVVQFEAGAADMIDTPPVADFARLTADPAKYAGLSNPLSGQYYYTAVNTLNAPTNNKQFRQGLNYAIDRKRFVERMLRGVGDPKALPWSKASAAFDQTRANSYAFDLDKAKSLIDASGAPKQIEFLQRSADPAVQEYVQAFQADLARIGVQATIKSVESPVWAATTNPTDGSDPKWQITVDTTGFAQMEPATVVVLSSHLTVDGKRNLGRFTNPEYQKLAEDAGVEPDPAKRKAIYARISDLLLDESWMMAMSAQAPRALYKANIRGASYTYHEQLKLHEVWMA